MQSEEPSPDEIAEMVDALLEDRLSPAEVRRLETLVCNHPAARRIYLRYVHLNCSIPPHLGVPASEPALPEEGAAPLGEPADLNETLMMPALRAERLEDEEEPPIVLPPAPPQPNAGRAGSFRVFRVYAAAAAVLIAAAIGIGLYVNRGGGTNVSSGVSQPLLPATQPAPIAPPAVPPAPQPVARLTALAGAVIEGPALRPGAPLFPGQALHLKGGAAQVTYDDGAVLVIEGPAELRIADGSTAQLDRGKLAARVPHAEHGFRVVSSKLIVTDLGTEFGVDVSRSGVAVAHVFEGRVEVALAGKSPDAPLALQLLDHDQTVQCSIQGGQIERVPKLAESFTRDIDQYTRPLPLHSTGEGLAEGAADPNWQFVGDSNHPNLVPRPATVAAPFTTYLPNTDASKWISTMRDLARLPAGFYTFRTHIDLAGQDPSMVKIIAHLAADDEVRAVRINGSAAPLPALGDPGRQYKRLHDFLLPSDRLVKGVNIVEFDVRNDKDEMSLRVEWEATARVRVVR